MELESIGKDLLKKLVYDKLVKLVIARIISKFTLLGWTFLSGPLAPLVSAVVGFVADYMFDILNEIYDLTKIVFVNEMHRKQFDNAELKLKIIAIEKGKDSDEFKVAQAKSIDALSNFVDMRPNKLRDSYSPRR